MIYRKVDLYEFFNIKRKGNEKGFLTIYVKDNSVEVNENRKYPGILVCPGGGYFFTSFREAEPVALKLLDNNICAFVLDYSCFNEGKYPSEFFEGYLALNYINQFKDEFHLDIEKLGIMGFSAGGHFAGLLSNNHLKEEFKEITENLPTIKFGAYIYPVNYFNKVGAHNDSFKNLTHNDLKLMEKLDFDKMINKNSPIGFIVSSFKDDAVGYQNTVALINAYTENNVPFESHIFMHGNHGISLGNESVYKKSMLDEGKINFSSWFNLFLNFLHINNFTIDE